MGCQGPESVRDLDKAKGWNWGSERGISHSFKAVLPDVDSSERALDYFCP